MYITKPHISYAYVSSQSVTSDYVVCTFTCIVFVYRITYISSSSLDGHEPLCILTFVYSALYYFRILSFQAASLAITQYPIMNSTLDAKCEHITFKVIIKINNLIVILLLCPGFGRHVLFILNRLLTTLVLPWIVLWG